VTAFEQRYIPNIRAEDYILHRASLLIGERVSNAEYKRIAHDAAARDHREVHTSLVERHPA